MIFGFCDTYQMAPVIVSIRIKGIFSMLKELGEAFLILDQSIARSFSSCGQDGACSDGNGNEG